MGKRSFHLLRQSRLVSNGKICESCRGGEMVDALALGASGATHGGSSPLLGTKAII